MLQKLAENEILTKRWLVSTSPTS